MYFLRYGQLLLTDGHFGGLACAWNPAKHSHVVRLCHRQQSYEALRGLREPGHSGFRACASENLYAQALQRFGGM